MARKLPINNSLIVINYRELHSNPYFLTASITIARPSPSRLYYSAIKLQKSSIYNVNFISCISALLLKIHSHAILSKSWHGVYYFSERQNEETNTTPTRVTATTGLNVQGIITDKIGREFTLDTGVKKVKVDTIEMGYNPLDDKGFQQMAKGDFVQVIGTLDVDFFEKAEIMADSVITLVKDSTKKKN